MEKIVQPSLNNYYYDAQIKKYLTQFGAIFSDLNVSVGKNDYKSSTNLIRVPIKYGSMDRVVAHIKTEHTGNKPVSVPMMSFNLQGLRLAVDRFVGVNTQHRATKVPVGGDVIQDGFVVSRRKPTPVYLEVELTLYASNTDQHFQMLEQLLLLFTPTLQFQTSDSAADWTAINSMELTNVNMVENYPADSNIRIIQSTLMFDVLCYLSPPANLSQNFITKAKLRIDALGAGGDVNETVSDNFRDTQVDTLYDLADYNIPKN